MNEKNLNKRFSIVENKSLGYKVKSSLFYDSEEINDTQSFLCMKDDEFHIKNNLAMGNNVLNYAK